MAATRSPSKISPKWVRQTRNYFLKFLYSTGFPPVERHGERGPTFMYPEWLIMLIGVLAVKCKEPTYLGIHRMTCRFWRELCGRQVRLPPIAESQLRTRGIRRGAPQAVQVVDRFHLVHNLREAVEAFLITQRPALQVAAVHAAQALLLSATPVPVTVMYGGKRQCFHIRQQQREAEQQRRHAPWVACYKTIHALYAQGTGITMIARQLGISRPTVYAYLRRATPPAPRSPQRSGQVLRPYVPYLIRHWREGITDSMRLWREIQRQGYTHSARTVCRFITRLRRAAEAGHAPEAHTSPYTRPQGPSARAVSFAMVCPGAKRSLEAQTYIDQLCQVDTGMARTHVLIQAFLTMVRERRGDNLEGWMAEATDSGIAALARLARGLRDDLAGVKAGLTLAWSNGVTEGQLHRRKLVKRQGYSRAGFALLRQRVLRVA